MEEGKVTDLRDGDIAEVIIPAEPVASGQLEVLYTLE
jgi:hypothetical protein